MEERIKLFNGDNMESLKKLPDNFVDSIVTDPPYGLSFMNKKWDYDVPSVEFWKEVYRVLKPGGHILSFGGTRTYHRMVVNMEDAGFEIRDQIMWVYGSGFPKSHNIGKAVDKLEGNEREVVGDIVYADGSKSRKTAQSFQSGGNGNIIGDTIKTKGISPYEGWGTGLKPANEPICVARKPLSEKSVAENVLKYGTGGINIDGCRIGTDTIKSVYGGFTNALVDGRDEDTRKEWIDNSKKENGQFNTSETQGRFPANFIIECTCDEVIPGDKGETIINEGNYNDTSEIYGKYKNIRTTTYTDKSDIHTNPDCPCRLLDEQSGFSKTNCKKGTDINSEVKGGSAFPTSGYKKATIQSTINDTGGASRFFYVAKVSKKERNMGLDEFEDKEKIQFNTCDYKLQPNGVMVENTKNTITKNNHPTVKPINLLTYLCRLITPKGGIILDPYMGSGSTGISALLEGFEFIGMEMDDEYFNIAEARINNYELYKTLIKK